MNHSFDRLTKIKTTTHENTPAFTVAVGKKIPNMEDHRSPEHKSAALESIMRVPKHRPSAVKFDGDPTRRALALTHEDSELHGNLPLINTLREARRYDAKPK